MQKTSHPTLRSVVWGSVIAASAILVSTGGCQSEETVAPSLGAISASGNAGTAGVAGLAGKGGASSSGGSTAANGGTAKGPVGGAVSTGGTLTASGGGGTGAVVSSGGNGGSVVSSTGGGGGTAGGASKPCVDVLPPPDPDWPDATCQKWATETPECSASWFANYCDISCGRCVPQGAGGSGGGGGSGGAPSKPCMDVEPPPDPKWPGATCEQWAIEAKACTESWFANYCDVSCGRCVPAGGTGGGGGGPSTTVDCSTKGLPSVTGGEGFATRYWDCCQTHCAQFNGHRCGQDGVSNTGNNQSACTGGGSFACYDEAPRAVDECVSYGHIAKSNPNCGGCYRIQFTGEGQHNVNDPGSKAIKGKQMVVKVTNTGGDVAGNQFDLMIPGGGVGQFNACTN